MKKSLLKMISIIFVLSALAFISYNTFGEDSAISDEVMKLHRDAIVCDLHADTQAMLWIYGYNMKKRHHTVDWGPAGVAPIFSDIDIPRAREGGLDLFNMSICPTPKDNSRSGAAAFTRRAMKAIDKMLAKNSADLSVAKSPEEAREIIGSGRIAVLLAIEGGQAIEEDMDILREYYDWGARYMTITHSKSLSWANSATDQPRVEGGLNDFGEEVVREMERMGMMIDVAHMAEDTFWAVLDTVSCPIIDTHAGARALADHPRNLTDDQIKAIAERGGVIGVIFHCGYLDPTGQKTCDAALVADHIDHIKKIGGIDCIALGSDYDGAVNIPPDLGNSSRLPALTAELKRRGYTEEEIRKILGGNFLKAWENIIR
jgi:membrane dipeptidase